MARARLSRPRLLFLVTEDWYFWSHRLDLARAAREDGFEVLVATRVGRFKCLLEAEGFRVLPLRFLRRGGGQLRDLAAILEVARVYRSEQPDIVHHVALKPILYGSLAARLERVPAVINAFGGLGYLFIRNGRRARLLRWPMERCLRWALTLKNSATIVQNSEDALELLRAEIVGLDRVVTIPGSGVDTTRFSPSPERDGTLVVMLASRMLWDKGVGEFVEAARILRTRGLQCRFVLVGMADRDNPAVVPESQLLRWEESSLVEWWRHRDDMSNVLQAAHIVVLPSYREGLPKVLLEAAACARPLVTTNVPGCRDAVRDGDTGLVVPVKDPAALAAAIGRLARDRQLRTDMGRRARERAVREFAVEKIARRTLEVYRSLLPRHEGRG